MPLISTVPGTWWMLDKGILAEFAEVLKIVSSLVT